MQTDVATSRMHSSKVWLDMLSLCYHLDDPSCQEAADKA
jgi:hypothetical protein